MTVRDAEPGDIYVDSQGKMWRCIGICVQPSVYFEEVEPEMRSASTVQKRRQNGGVTGLMFDGWERIFRPKGKSPEFPQDFIARSSPPHA